MKKSVTLDEFMKEAFKNDEELKYEYDKLESKFKLIKLLIKIQNKYNISTKDMKKIFNKLDKVGD